jgi:hypothetical protein
MPSKITPIRKVLFIKSIEQKPTSKGKPMWTITDEQDDFYSVFDEFVRSRLAEGQHNAVMVKIEPRGDRSYKNIVGIAETTTAEAPPTNLDELRIDNEAPVTSPKPQQSSTPPPPVATPTQAPAPTPRPAAPTPANDRMVDIRMKALELSVSLTARGQATAAQIEPNANSFVSYILGEQNSSSRGGTNEFAQ